MALPRIAASPLSLPMASLALLVAVALVLVALAPTPATSARLLQARPLERGWPVSGDRVEALAPRLRRSPREKLESQEDGNPTEPVDPEQKPQRGGFFKNLWRKTKEFAKKVVEVVREILDVIGAFGQPGGAGGPTFGADVEAETMNPDRLNESEVTTEQ